VDVITDGSQIAGAAAIDDQGFVPAAEQMAKQFVATVEASGVGAQQPFHAGNQIGLGCFDDEMKMIVHQAIRMNLPTGLRAGLTQCLEETEAILVIAENRFAAVTTIQHMINGSWILEAQLSGHGAIAPIPQPNVNTTILGTDPFAQITLEKIDPTGALNRLCRVIKGLEIKWLKDILILFDNVFFCVIKINSSLIWG
jgi:hypothetical protein